MQPLWLEGLPVTAPDQLREAATLLDRVADDDGITDLQQRTAAHLAGVVVALAESVATVQERKIATDGGRSKCPDWDGPHQWTTVDGSINWGDSSYTSVVERCTECGDLRVDETVEVIEVIDDAE
jgi:hypothetical protein